MFIKIIQFEVVEEVTHESGAIHAEGLESVSLPPMAKYKALAVEQPGAEGNSGSAVAHPWRERLGATMNGNMEWAEDIFCKVDGYFYVLVVLNG